MFGVSYVDDKRSGQREANLFSEVHDATINFSDFLSICTL
jgi:hypothetical protein